MLVEVVDVEKALQCNKKIINNKRAVVIELLRLFYFKYYSSPSLCFDGGGGGGGGAPALFIFAKGGGGGGGISPAVFFLTVAGGGGGGAGLLSPFFTITGGVNFTGSGAVGGWGFFFFGLLVTVTGMASAPFSTLGFVDAFACFLSCAFAKMPIPNRKKAIIKRRRFIFFVLARMPNVINSIKCPGINTRRFSFEACG